MKKIDLGKYMDTTSPDEASKEISKQ